MNLDLTLGGLGRDEVQQLAQDLSEIERDAAVRAALLGNGPDSLQDALKNLDDDALARAEEQLTDMWRRDVRNRKAYFDSRLIVDVHRISLNRQELRQMVTDFYGGEEDRER